MSLRVIVPVALAGATLWALTAVAACIVLLLLSLVPYPRDSEGGAGLSSPAVSAYAPSAEALADIPSLYLELYRSAAARFDLDWTILAAIGKVECDHGRDPDPSCTQEGHLNYAGAGGPAQFLLSTWKEYGISAGGPGPPDMWNPADAIFSMANYLHAAGAPGDYPRAIFAYNHAWWYVADVLAWARRYRDDAAVTSASQRPRSRERSRRIRGAPTPERLPLRNLQNGWAARRVVVGPPTVRAAATTARSGTALPA